jgi:hypothetical protein
VVDAHRPTDEGGLSFSVESGGIDDCFLAQPCDCGDVLRVNRRHRLGKLFVSACMGLDISRIDQTIADEHMRNAVDERDIAAWLEGKMNVGHPS